MTATDLEAGIRDQAYQLWEAAGRPEGCDLEHWLQAEAIVSAAPPAEVPATPKRAKKAETSEPKPARAKKAKATA